jgi:hypothetical protein
MVRRTAAADAASTCAEMERRLGSTDLLLQAMNRAMGIPVPLFWIGWLGRSCLLGERERDDEEVDGSSRDRPSQKKCTTNCTV